MAARAVDVGAIVVGIEAETSRFVRGITQAQTKLVGFGKSAQATGHKMSAFGRTISFAFALPLAGVAMSVKAFAGFDAAMTRSLAIMGDVSDGMRRDMARTAEEMSKQTTFAAKDLAEAYFFLASAGFDAQQSMAALPVVAKFAQAGNFDLSQATEMLGDSLAALGLQVDDFQQNMTNMTRLSDVLVKANVLAQATTQQFAGALTRAAGIMKAYNIDVEEGVAVMAAFAKTGQKGEEGGEAFARMLRLMVPAAVKNEKAWKRLNIRMFTADGYLRNIADVIGEMEDAFKSIVPEMRTVELEALGFEKRMQGMILPIIGFSESIRGWEKDLLNAAGTTEEVAAKQLRAFNAQIKIMWNRIMVAAKRIGKVLIPALTWGARFVARITDAVERLDDRTVKWALAIGGAVAAMGPLLMIGGGLITTLGSLSILVGGLGAAFVAGLSGIFSTVAVLGALGLIIASLVPGIKNLTRTGDVFGDRFAADVGGGLDEVNTKTMDVGGGLDEVNTKTMTLQDRFEEVGATMTQIGPMISLEWSNMIGKIALVADIVRDNVLISFRNFWNFLKAFFPWFSSNWWSTMDYIMDGSVLVIKNMTKNWKEFGLSILRFMMNPLRGFDFDTGKLTEGLEKIRPKLLPELQYETEEYLRDFTKELEEFQREIDEARDNLVDPSKEIAALNAAMDAAHASAEKRKQDLKDLQLELDGVLGKMRATGDTRFAEAIEEGSAAAARAAFAMAEMNRDAVEPPRQMDFPDPTAPDRVNEVLDEAQGKAEAVVGILNDWKPPAGWPFPEQPLLIDIQPELPIDSPTVPPVEVPVVEDVYQQFLDAWAEIGEEPPVTLEVDVDDDTFQQFLDAWKEVGEGVPPVEVPVTVGEVPEVVIPVTVGEVPEVAAPQIPAVEVPVEAQPMEDVQAADLPEPPVMDIPLRLEGPIGTALWGPLGRESVPEIEVGVKPVWRTFTLTGEDFKNIPEITVPVEVSEPDPVTVPVDVPEAAMSVPEPDPVMVQTAVAMESVPALPEMELAAAIVDLFIPPLPEQALRAVVDADTGALESSLAQLQLSTAPAQLPAVEAVPSPVGAFAPGVDQTAEVASGLRQLLEEDKNQTTRMRAMVDQQSRTNQLLEAAGKPEVVTIS